MAQIHQIHDKFFKRSLKEKRIAVDFLGAHLPPTLFQRLDIKTLSLTDKSLVLPKLREVHCDVIYQCKIGHQDSYIFFLLEHQSNVPELMAFRKLQYTVGLMDDHLRAGHTKLPLVLPICLYHGNESPYPRSRDIYDEFSHPELAREFFFKPFHLIDLTTLSQETIETHGLAALMEMLFKHYQAKDVANKFKQIMQNSLFTRTIYQIGKPYLVDVINYMLYSDRGEHSPSADTLIDVLVEVLPNEREAIMTFAEQLEYRGKQKGIQEGWQASKIEIAKNMLAEGFDFSIVKKMTGLSNEEMTALAQKH